MFAGNETQLKSPEWPVVTSLSAHGSGRSDPRRRSRQRDDPHLTLAHDNVDANLSVFSIGTSTGPIGLQPGVYYVTSAMNGQPTESQPGAVNRDFSQVTPDGSVYCYETERRSSGRVEGTATLLIIMPDTETLRPGHPDEPSCGSGPWAMYDSVGCPFIAEVT